jgi:hypothetical protein
LMRVGEWSPSRRRESRSSSLANLSATRPSRIEGHEQWEESP